MRVATLLCFFSLSACAMTGAITDGSGASGVQGDDASIGDGASTTDTHPLPDGAPAPTDTGSTTTPPGSDSGTTPPTDTGGPTPPPTDSGSSPPTDTGSPPTDTGTPPVDSGGPAPVCTSPYKPPASGACGIERWSIKVGEDGTACSMSLAATPTTIASLRSLPAAGGGTTRAAPTEDTVFILHDVTLVQFKLETDSDYHLVIADASGSTMIAEIPDPNCMPASGPWQSFVKTVRSTFDARHPASSGWSYPSETITIKGVGFFDAMHGQTGVAPNAIELHPVLGICFGAGCTPP